MAVLYNVPAGQSATIVGPAEVSIRGSWKNSYLVYDTGGNPGTPPTITSLVPATKPLPSCELIVRGTGFSSTAVILFNGVAVPTAFVSETKLTATVSATTAGPYPIKVRTAAGDSAAATFTFT